MTDAFAGSSWTQASLESLQPEFADEWVALRERMRGSNFEEKALFSLSKIMEMLPTLVVREEFTKAPDLRQTIGTSFHARVENFLLTSRRWREETESRECFIPLHGFAEIFDRLRHVWDVVQHISAGTSVERSILIAIGSHFEQVSSYFAERHDAIEISELRWSLQSLHRRFDESDHERENALQELEVRTARAISIAKSLETSDHRYKGMTEAKAEELLVGNFENFRNGHRWGYGLFLAGALSLMGIGVFLAFTLSTETLKDASTSAFSYPDLIWRITLVTGILGIATYMARQAGQHRTLATWASSICVQLQTFDAYTEQIGDPDQVNLLRAEFAKRVFGTQPQLKGEPDQAAGAMDLLPIIAAIAKATKTEGAKAP